MTFKYNPINGWTKERIIAQLREKLPKDGSRAGFINEDGAFICCYRAPDGCCCAAGSFIPDDKYDPSFENKSIDFLPSVLKIMPLQPFTMWQLQHVHDNTRPDESAVERCVEFVEKNVEDKQ